MIDPDVSSIIAPHLREGETLRWAGRPQNGPFLKRYLLLIWFLPFFIIIFTTGMFAALLPFLIIAGAVFVQLGFHWYVCAKQSYAVTDKRVLIVNKPGWVGNVSIPAGEQIWLVEKGDRAKGTIWFSEAMPFLAISYYKYVNDRKPFEFGMPAIARYFRSTTVAFFNIKDREAVRALLPVRIMDNP